MGLLLSGLAVIVGLTTVLAQSPDPAPAAPAVSPLNFPENPWFVGDGVAPNLLLTFDDSESMKYGNAIDIPLIDDTLVQWRKKAWDAVNWGPWTDIPNPNNLKPQGTEILDDMSWTSAGHAIAYKSDLNSLYYNPRVTYTPPKRADGSSFDQSSFTAAPPFGYWPTLHPTVNLDSEYRPVMMIQPYTFAFYTMHHCLEYEAIPAAVSGLGTRTCPGTGVNFDSYVAVNSKTGNARTEELRWKSTAQPIKWHNFQQTTPAQPATKAYWFEYKENVSADAPPRCPAQEPGATERHLYTQLCWYTPSSGGANTCPPNPTLTEREGLPESCRTYRADPSPRCPLRSTIKDLSTVSSQCFAIKYPETTAEKQNFANWYSYYRTRNMVAASVAMRFLDGIPSDWRVTWQGLNSCKNFGLGADGCKGFGRRSADTQWSALDVGNAIDNRLGPFDATQRTEMWKYLTQFPASGSTPSREAMINAGEFVAASRSALFADNPRADSASQTQDSASCRRNYHIMITDGVPTGEGTEKTHPDHQTTTVGNTSYSYAGTTASRPYYGAEVKSMADLAFSYWVRDLQPSIGDNVPPNMPIDTNNPTNDFWDLRNNPATWQHLSSFIITFGMRSYFNPGDWENSGTTGGLLGKVMRGEAEWPNAKAAGLTTLAKAQALLADQWHAAINSRGDFYSAESPDEVLASLESIKRRIAQAEGGASAVASSSLTSQADTYLFSTSFSSRNWPGTLRAFKLDATGTPTLLWNTDQTLALPRPGGIAPKVYIKSAVANAASLLAMPADNTLDGTPLSAAQRASLADQASALGTALAAPTLSGADLLKWLLGDTSISKLRPRTQFLGDLVNAQPAFEGGRDYGYVSVAWGADSTDIAAKYAEYQSSKFLNGSIKNPTVYVGSNDGMIHALDAATGAHRWAYLPTPFIDQIGKRANPNARHVWGMDGPIVTHDVWDSNSPNQNKWKTILVATAGVGAKGLVALDVSSDPAKPTLLWEWFPSSDADMGYVTGEPVIARAMSGQWVVVLGNGYNSTNNSAALLVLDALNGAVIRRITTTSTTAVTTPNGLSAPALLYLPGKRLKFGYAGDLQGNVWRFDLGHTDPAQWGVSMTGKPLATLTRAGNPQPITAKIRIASDRQQGRMLLFGTGRLLDVNDPAVNRVQSLYGIWDQPDVGSSYVPISRADLQVRNLVQETSTSNTRTITGNPIGVGKRGWRLDLYDASTIPAGERVVAPVNYLPEASLMVASTIRPISSAPSCGSRIESWQLILSPFDGTGLNILKLPGNNTPFAGLKKEGMLAPSSPLRDGTGKASLVLNEGLKGVSTVKLERTSNARVGWVQPR